MPAVVSTAATAAPIIEIAAPAVPSRSPVACAVKPWAQPHLRPCLTMRLPTKYQHAIAGRSLTVSGRYLLGPGNGRVVKLQTLDHPSGPRGNWQTIGRGQLRGGEYRITGTRLPHRFDTVRVIVGKRTPGAGARGYRAATAASAPPVGIEISTVISGFGTAARVFSGLRACQTDAGCFSSKELQKLYEIDGKLDKVITTIGELDTKIDTLTTDVREGFRQLQVDVKASAYASAVRELDQFTTQSREAYGKMMVVLTPEPHSPDAQRDRRIRDRAFADFRAYAARLDGRTLAMLRAVGGDPTNALSNAGVLPSAWELLLAKERQVQGVPTDKDVPYLSRPLLDQMRAIGMQNQYL